jgi:hypothetical protein
MTKDVRDKQPSAVQGITLSSTSNLIMTSSLPAILTSHGGAA